MSARRSPRLSEPQSRQLKYVKPTGDSSGGGVGAGDGTGVGVGDGTGTGVGDGAGVGAGPGAPQPSEQDW